MNEQLAEHLQAEIVRFGLHDTATNCCGLAVYADDGVRAYPPGCLRLDGDGGGETLVDADATLRRLRAASRSGVFERDQQAFYAALVRWPTPARATEVARSG